MDKDAIVHQLRVLAESIAENERQINQQRKLIEDLRRDQHRTTEAERRLTKLQDAQALHVVDRDKLTAALAKAECGQMEP